MFYDSGEGSQRQIRTKTLNHAITIAEDIKASVTTDTEYALTGETVTLTLGTAVDASTLKVNNGAISLTNTGDGKYTFTMPDGNVTVTATVAETYSVSLPNNMEIVSASAQRTPQTRTVNIFRGQSSSLRRVSPIRSPMSRTEQIL